MNLVLHHGIFGFAAHGGVVYFNGVKDHLVAKFPGLRVLATQVAPDGTIEVRGTELGRQILRALQPGGEFDPGETVHVIAHSMGGLDARFLLSPDNPDNLAERVVSLTTISTPHRGSPIADLLVAAEDAADIGEGENTLGHALRAAASHANIHVGGLRDLTTEGVARFNERFSDSNGTKKFSVAGVGRGIKVLGVSVETCAVLSLAHRIIKEKTGEENDGLVSVGSAAWGEGPETWPADHADEIGHNLDLGLQARTAHFDYLARYEVLVDRLRDALIIH